MAKNDTLSGFIVRQAEPRDEGAIKEICRISFDRFYSHFASRSLRSSDQVLLSENSESVVGFAALKSVHIGNHVVGNILWLAVHPEHRLKGVASGLLDSSTAYFGFHGMDHVYVSVRKENSVALRFFERKGFRKLDFRGLLRLYGRRVLEVYSRMRIPPGEIVLATTIQSGQNCQQTQSGPG